MANIEKLQNPLKITEIADKINEIIEGGTGGSGLIFGSTIFSLIPLTEAGLHLLDGSLLNVGGIYDEAITKIAALQTSNPNLFTTEENWQSSVSSHGVCGKFVYVDGVSLRLPKVTGFVEGTLDSGALGDLVEAGLPNITGGLGFGGYRGINGDHQNAWHGAGYESAFTQGIGPSTNNAWGTVTTGFSAEKSNPLYGKSNTVQPQAIKGYLYIVLATSAKTNVQVNIDNVVTDLNGKAGTDLANINSEGKNVIADLFLPDYSAPTQKASGAAAPSIGWAVSYGFNATISMQVNGVQVAQGNWNAGVWSGNWNMQIMVDEGDVVTGASWWFFPCKGVV